MTQEFTVLAFEFLKPSKQPCVLFSQSRVLQTKYIQLRRLPRDRLNWLFFFILAVAFLQRTRASDHAHARAGLCGAYPVQAVRAPDPKKKSLLLVQTN